MLDNECGVGDDRSVCGRGDLDQRHLNTLAAIKVAIAAADAEHEAFYFAMPEHVRDGADLYLSLDSLYASYSKSAERALYRSMKHCSCLECQRDCREHKVESEPDPSKYEAAVASANYFRDLRARYDDDMQAAFEHLTADQKRIVEAYREYRRRTDDLHSQIAAARLEYARACGCEGCATTVWVREQAKARAEQ